MSSPNRPIVPCRPTCAVCRRAAAKIGDPREVSPEEKERHEFDRPQDIRRRHSGLFGLHCLDASEGVRPTPYRAEGNAIVGHNLRKYHNRPLFINNTNVFLLAGRTGRWCVSARASGCMAVLMIALVRGAEGG